MVFKSEDGEQLKAKKKSFCPVPQTQEMVVIRFLAFRAPYGFICLLYLNERRKVLSPLAPSI